MLDSYELIKSEEVKFFNATMHLTSLVQDDFKLRMSEFVYVSYPYGWTMLIEELMLIIKDFPIEITEVNDKRGQLEINFQMVKQRKEVLVWRALEEAKVTSRHLCIDCGKKVHDKRRLEHLTGKCEQCFNEAGKTGKTGTWLDRY